MTVTKNSIVTLICEELGFNKREAKNLADSFFEEIADALVVGEVVKISGFGRFSTRIKGERPGRNPRTGEAKLIAARRVVSFRASKKFKLGISEKKCDS